MLNISELITDPMFCQSITITRNSGGWVNGDFTITDTQTIPFVGVINALTTKEIMQLPDGDNIKGAVHIYTKQPVYTTHLDETTGNTGAYSDEFTWKNEPYKITQVRDMSDFGYYRALAVRKWGA